ncbi:hypothetical protein Neosp_009100 [[Neocosmospora] mangrovei]
MSGPSDPYGNPYEQQYTDYHARQEGSAYFDQDASYAPEEYYPHDSTSGYDSHYGFENDENHSYRDVSARYGDYDPGSSYWQDGQAQYHAGDDNNGWNDGYGSRDDAGQYSATSSEVFFGADDSAAYDQEDIEYPSVVHPSPDPYPAWASDNRRPLATEEIEEIFLQLTETLGFQRESMRNMFDHLMILLDSRASRMPAEKALVSLHADYIGGRNANYRTWYFAAYFDLDAQDGSPSNTTHVDEQTDSAGGSDSADATGGDEFQLAEERWQRRMQKMPPQERVRQLALYLLCWGEANQVRFMPECLCFIFKCAEDFLAAQSRDDTPAEELSFLDHVITPIYRFLRDQGYEIRDGVYVRRERDHDKVVGYDDCNQLFWYPQGMRRIVLNDKTKLFDIPASQRLARFKDINWGKSFFKTYRESRSLLHLLVNFNRIWIIHLTIFWFYTAFNVPTLIVGSSYEQQVNQSPTNAKKLSAVGFGGAIAPFLQLLATIAEWIYVPRRWPGAEPIALKMVILLVALVLNVAPGVKIFFFPGPKKLDDYLAMGHVGLATQLFAFLAIMPSGNLLGNFFKKKSRRATASEVFTAKYPPLHGNNRVFSYLFWTLVFGAKFGESYVFLALSFRDPVRYLSIMNVDSCQGDNLFGSILCRQQPTILLVLMMMTDLIFFFLDTYLWYVLVNTVCSILRSFYIGSSIWTPWRNIFYRLPKRIYSKVLATGEMEIKYKPKVLVSQVWNAIIISMYREHLLSIEHVQKLLYHQVPSEEMGKRTLRAPTFFVAQGDHWFDSQYFPKNGEAERRISFFAQSLSTPIPEPMPVDNMPTFTVMIPHYSEKILFSLREIIREEDQYSRLTMLEYLKQLHPHEWSCFVRDTKALAGEDEPPHDSDSEVTGQTRMERKVQDLPFYFIGFKSSAPEYALRTRIWASLRSQTLYRTVSGFMNYARALKLLYRVENPEVVQLFRQYPEKLELQLERMARRKFRMVVAMQRYAKFKQEEQENVEFLLRAYPDLQIAYLDEEASDEGGEPRVYSSLIDGHSEVLENGLRRPKFRIQLSGNPILGDGKSDNQNHALIFYRGEYIQLIDANQDNYLEECLKIRGVLAEFDEMSVVSGYDDDSKDNSPEPIAILGTREYIFSENVGILGDIAAGKEQTFGTLFARTLAQLGGKLHYGHPDFLNGIFMTTRGGVSKAQKGLHLNEDIYAGMNAIMRGGRIKHCEFYQCGKGRDLGFGSILNFVTKIGTGMGEQMLSREYFYLGTKLPLDRFLSFYYAHPGFHINNMFIMASVYMFLISLLNLGSLRHETISCDYDRDVPITDPLFPTGCSVLFGEILLPLLSVIMTTLPYLYINAQTGVIAENNRGEKVEPTDSLIRLLIIAFAPMAINSGTLAVMLSLSCLTGPLLSLCCKQFGKVLASITYGISVIALIISFEAMLFLEGFNFTRALAGMIAVVSLQILVCKIIISTTLTREFKTASSSTAFWTGHWYSLGRHSITAPFREIVCKITELTHTTMLFWLLPSQQIREPIYSMKQSKLRRRRVVRFAVVYFTMLLVAVGLILAPMLAGKYIPSSVSDMFTDLAGFHLLQPSGQDRDNTNGTQQTGTGMPGYTGAGLTSSTSGTRGVAATTQ